MLLLIDSREQKPLKFHEKHYEMQVVTNLPYGDYSCHEDGHVCPVFFERKGIGDLFGTMGRGHDRFKREVNRCVKDGNKLVVIIEGSLTEIKAGYEHSRISGDTMVKTLFTMMIKNHIPFVCCTSRFEMETYITGFYYGYFKNLKTLNNLNNRKEEK
jgi:ERCC4-type nuclease